MTITEYHSRKLRHTRIKGLFDTSEMLLLVLVFVWGLQLLFLFATLQITSVEDYVALSVFTPYVSMPSHGSLLITLALFHFISIVEDKTSWRRRCIFLEMLFFIYVTFSLIYRGQTGLDLAATIVEACFSAANFYTLMRPST